MAEMTREEMREKCREILNHYVYEMRYWNEVEYLVEDINYWDVPNITQYLINEFIPELKEKM